MFVRDYFRCFVSKVEHEEVIKRMEAEQKRINQRLELLEKLDEKIYQVGGSIEKMSVNVENMLKAQEKHEKKLEFHDLRIDSLENKNGKKWEELTGHIWKIVVAGVVGYFLAAVGLG